MDRQRRQQQQQQQQGTAYRGEFLVEERASRRFYFIFQLQKGNARKQAEVANIVSSRVVACAAPAK
ncbi:hypothetical protein K0M31_002071, partial [Melipona bicolor]